MDKADNIQTNIQLGGVERNSGIELLKVIGIFLIVLSHVAGSIRLESDYVSYNDYVLFFSAPTWNIQYLILDFFSYSGMIGNAIFFISSAWFLLDSKKVNYKKWFFMLVEVWVISIVLLCFSLIVRSGDIKFNLIVKSLLPNIFANNWFITCYLLFYPVHTILNKIIKEMSQRQLFATVCALFVICFIIGWVQPSIIYISRVISWVAIYFLIAYMKLYMKNFSCNKKANIIMLIVCIVCLIAVILIFNVLGMYIDFFADKMIKLVNNHYNPIVILTVLAMFNLARMSGFKNKFINYIASLSLLVYLLPENIILRNYYRPLMLQWVYQTFGYSQVVLLMLATSFVVFVGTIIIAFIYDKTLRRFVRKLGEVVHKLCSRIWNVFANLATTKLI